MPQTTPHTTEMQSFIDNAIKTESRNFPVIAERLSTVRNIRCLHASIGLVGEAAEMLDAMKKHIFYGKPLDVVNIKEEAGDALWYLGILFNEMGWSFEEVAALVTNKLKLRYPDALFTSHSAIHRDTSAERALLEAPHLAARAERFAAPLVEENEERYRSSQINHFVDSEQQLTSLPDMREYFPAKIAEEHEAARGTINMDHIREQAAARNRAIEAEHKAMDDSD